jgi:hypothetical protein
VTRFTHPFKSTCRLLALGAATAMPFAVAVAAEVHAEDLCGGRCGSSGSEFTALFEVQEQPACGLNPRGDCGPGTLFQWSGQPVTAGGPDLDAPLVTDRPDFTEASSTVGCGVAQLEFGYTYTFDEDGGSSTKSHSYPEPLLRYGVLQDWLEFRIAWNYTNEESAGVKQSGSEDLYLGFKIGLTPQDGWRPEMALIPQMTVPTGSDAFTTDEVLPGLNWIYGWELTDTVSTAGSTQFNRAVDEMTADTYTEWAQSWTVAYTLTETVGAYTEWFALIPSGADTARTEHYFNGGFTWLMNNDVQWDIRAGTGLNDAADDYFVGTGLSIRFQ